MINIENEQKIDLKKIILGKSKLKVILVILVIGLLLSAFTWKVSVDHGSYKEEKGNTSHTVKQTVGAKTQNIVAKDNGWSVDIDIGTTVDEIIQELDKNNGVIDKYIAEGKQKEYLTTFIKAGLITQYPDLRSDFSIPPAEGEFQGCIQINRSMTDGTTKRLTYVPYETFSSYIENNQSQALNHFSLDKDGSLVVAGWTRTTTNITSNEPGIENVTNKVEYNLTSKPIPYKTSVDSLSMPFDFLWALTVSGQDAEFAFNVAQLALQSEIVITIQEDFSTYISESTETYDVQERSTQYAKHELIYKNNITNPEHEEVIETQIPYETVRTVKREICAVKYNITKADTWLQKYENTYSVEIPEGNGDPITGEPEKIDDTSFQDTGESLTVTDEFKDEAITKLIDHLIELCGGEEEYKKALVEGEWSLRIINMTHKKEKRTINHQIITTNTNTVNNHIIGTPTVIEKMDKESTEDNFVTLFLNSKNARTAILGEPDWLFTMLESSPDTSNMVELVKYLLYKATDIKDFGVTEWNFSIFDLDKFKSISSGIYGNTIEEKVWFVLINAGYSKEAAAGAMGNFWGESGFRTNNLENSFETKLGHTDESYTEAIDNGSYSLEQFISDHDSDSCGAGYGLTQWTYYTRKKGLYQFAKSKSVSIANENMQIEYMLGELNSSGGADGFATCQLSAYNGFTIYDWTHAETPEAAAEAFCWIFEKPSGYSSARATKAREYYEKYKDLELGGIYQANTNSASCITGTYTSGITGRTFTIFNQMKITTDRLWTDRCNRAAQISLCSGYYNGDSLELINMISSSAPRDVSVYGECGLTCLGNQPMTGYTFDTNKIKEQIQGGGYIVLYVRGSNVGDDGVSKHGRDWASSMHWVSILGYDITDGEERIFVSDSGHGNTGWVPLDEFDGITECVVFVNEK